AHEQEFGSVPHRFLPLLPGFAAGERPLELRRMLSGGKNETRRHNGLNASVSAAAIGAALRASGLLEAKQALPFSRCGFCSHPRHETRHCQKRRRALDLRRMNPAVEGRTITIGDGARPAANLLDSLPASKGKQNADRRGFTCLPCGKRAPCRARSPVGVPRRFCPWDSRIPRCGLGPGFAALAPRWRGSPAGANPGYSEAPRTPVIVPADLMSANRRLTY